MKNKYIIDTLFEESFDATSKARKDIEKSLCELGYEAKNIIIKKPNGYYQLFMNIFESKKQLKSLLKNVEEESDLLFQYPWDSFTYGFSKYIKRFAKNNNSKTIVVIHDLNSQRSTSAFGRFYYNHIIKEFKYLNNFDYVICHNRTMKKLLVNNGIDSKKIVVLELFDYLSDFKPAKNKDINSVGIAGNLSVEKSKFLYEYVDIKRDYNIHLYGTNYNSNLDRKDVLYHGKFPPDELVSTIESGFGLVWDGDSVDDLQGNFGKYELINNPHKASLYVACGMPLIVNSKAAIANFVKENNIGYTVDSLHELSEVFKKEMKNYDKYKENVDVVSAKVRKGEFIKEAIKKCK